MSLLQSAGQHAWQMLLEAAPYIWLGLLAAGVLHALVPRDWVTARLGGGGQASVWKAALLGVPLPLCSCGVIPAAVGLRKQGAGRGATLSFLISTPETSIDSLALTYALLGPIWTLIRPIAAVLIAVGTGSLANILPDTVGEEKQTSACALCSETATHRHSVSDRLRRGWRFVFRELLPDIGGWLLVGLLLSGLLLAALPADFLTNLPGGAALQMLLALLVGVPLYICASASTPLAAALLAKGIAPGAALVLLLAGPATNLASAVVIARHLGRFGTAVYFGGVAVGSLAVGAAVQWVAPSLRLDQATIVQAGLPVWANLATGGLLVMAILLPWLRKAWRRVG